MRYSDLEREFQELLPAPQEDPIQQQLRVGLARVFKAAMTTAMQTKTVTIELSPAANGLPAVTTNYDSFVGFDPSVGEDAAAAFATTKSLWEKICTIHHAVRFSIMDYRDEPNVNTQHILVNLGNGNKKMSFVDVIAYLEEEFGV